jgi:hypothetical protein
MLSAVIPSAHRQRAMLLAEQPAHERCVRPGPLVLGTAPFKFPAPTVDRDRHSVTAVGQIPDRWPGRFRLALHVAMQVGLSLHHDGMHSSWVTEFVLV